MEYEKKIKSRAYLMVFYIIIGAALWAAAFFSKGVNDTLSAVGIALIAAGAVQLGRNIRLLKNPERLRECEIAEKDERNVMLMEKARSLSFAVYITLASAAVIILYAINKDTAGQIIAYTVCGFCLIYCICYMIVKKRY